MQERILLTGATGFIGSYVLQELLHAGYHVAIILRPESNTWRIKDFLNQVTVLHADVEQSQYRKDLETFAPEYLVHLGWQGVENRFRNDHEQINTNMQFTLNLLRALDATPLKKILGFGSQAEYGPCSGPITEDQPTRPTTFYGVAKLSVCHLMRVYAENRQIEYAWLRIFSTYGPKDNASWMIPSLIQNVRKGLPFDLTKGEQRWDYLFVTDAARAIVAVLQSTSACGIFNLGSGTALTIRSIAEQIRDVINPNVQLNFGAIPYRPDQVMYLKADITRLRQLAAWLPTIEFNQGIEQTIAGT